MEQAKILNILPTPILIQKYVSDTSVVASFLDSLELIGDMPQVYGLHSKDTYVLDHKECFDLKKFILTNVTNFAKKVLKYDYSEYRLSQSWVTHKEPGQFHNQHSHPNSLISGVFYYGDFDQNTPSIKFHKTLGAINASYLSPKYTLDKNQNEITTDEYQITCENNLLLLFPSYLYHSVPLNTTNKVRKSLAFNILPKGKIGDPNTLTELIFDRLV